MDGGLHEIGELPSFMAPAFVAWTTTFNFLSYNLALLYTK